MKTTDNTPAPDHGEPVAWMHTLDNTEGIPSNRPMVVFDTSPNHPFGQPGKDYSPEFAVVSVPLYLASHLAAMREAMNAAAAKLRYIVNEADALWDIRDEARFALTKLQPYLK